MKRCWLNHRVGGGGGGEGCRLIHGGGESVAGCITGRGECCWLNHGEWGVLPAQSRGRESVAG